MPVHLNCACGKVLRARDELIGKRVKCPGCGAVLLIKAAPEPEEPADEGIQQEPPARRRAGEGEPAGEGRLRPRQIRKQAGGNLVLWLALGGGVGLVAVVAVVLIVVLGGSGPRKESVRPGAGWKGQPGAQAELGLNEEGFITTWLLLAPIPLEANQSGADALTREQVEGEARLRPRAGDKVQVRDQELVWKEYRARGYFFDFNDLLGQQTEDSVGYAVCYIHAPQERRDITLRIGSDDQAKVYLNGQEVLRQDQTRPLVRDQDITEVSLRRGVNVLVFKVVNEKRDWSGCARFTDRDGNFIENLKVTASPE